MLTKDEISEKTIGLIETLRTTCNNYYLKDIKVTHTIEQIGKGSYGEVQKVITNEDEIVALKISRGKSFCNLKNEAMILSMCNHPNIVKFYGYKQRISPYFSSGQMFIEYCESDLQNYIEERRRQNNPLTQYEIKMIFNQMVSASEYLYNQFGIVHRDIKLENYLVQTVNNEIKIKLCDFGFATKSISDMKEYVGSPSFCAPEILANTPYSYKAELFSLGICLYYMLNGRMPFKAQTSNQLMQFYKLHSQFIFEKSVENDLVSLCQNCLEYNVEKRISINELHSKVLIEC